jgi:SEC-C motif
LYHRRHSESKPKPWFERSSGALLRQEQAVVNEYYPGLVFRADDAGLRMSLEGDFILEADCGVPTRIRTRIDFPSNYPASEPTAYDAAGHFPTGLDRHILPDGQFCLWLPPCSSWDNDNPSSLLRFLDEVTVFLERQLIYDATGGREWPGPQYKHGKYGYIEFMLSILGNKGDDFRTLFPVILGHVHPERNELCPCGSKRKYKRCHADRVESIIHRVGRRRLDTLFKDSESKDTAEAKL